MLSSLSQWGKCLPDPLRRRPPNGGVWVRNADVFKEGWPGGPELFITTLFRDCSTLAIHQVWCERAAFPHEDCLVKPL